MSFINVFRIHFIKFNAVAHNFNPQNLFTPSTSTELLSFRKRNNRQNFLNYLYNDVRNTIFTVDEKRREKRKKEKQRKRSLSN